MIAKLNHIINTNDISIDSIDVKIPFDKVNVLDQNLLHCWERVNTGTGDIAKNSKSSPSTLFDNNLYSIVFKVKHEPFKDLKGETTTKPYLVILLTSKVLHSNYLQGITKDNSEDVLQWINDSKIVKIQDDDFYLNSRCSNIDTKIDFNLDDDDDDWHSFLSSIIQVVRPSKLSDIGYRKFTYQSDDGKKHTNGIYLGSQKGLSVSRPFVRMYHKTLQLYQMNRSFVEAYLNDSKLVKNYRIEMNIKNKKHLKSLSIDDNSFKGIVTMSQKKKKEIMGNGVVNHLESILKIKRESKLNIRDKFDAFLIELISKGKKARIGQNFNLDKEFEMFCFEYDIKRSAKSKFKVRLETIRDFVESMNPD